jgi:hypothetical protein
MHRAGIDHRDLHLGNIVGRVEKGEARVHIVDWDRACFRAAGAWNPLENLVRLWRSAEKGRRKGTFEPDGSPGGSPAGAPPARAAPSFTRPARAFLRGYFHRRPRDLRRARRYFRRQALWLGVRSWFWGSPA